MSSAPAIDLAQFLASNRQEDLAAEADFQGLFTVTVGYLSQRELLRARRRSLAALEQSPDDIQERFARELAGLVRGWQGLTLGVLAELTDVSLPAEADPQEPIPCTPANVAALYVEVPALFEFVLAKAGDLAGLRRARAEEERKN